MKVWTVSDITAYIRVLFAADQVLNRVAVKGEISNYSVSPAGHAYFNLKDRQSQMNAVMFQSRLGVSAVRPANGQKVVAIGRISVYEAAGRYQITVDELQADGAGDLFTAFVRLKEKLAAEGLFEPARKKALPSYPHAVGLVTSPQGAALHDMVRILRQRCPGVRIVVSPARVQGDDAPHSLAKALQRLVRVGGIDVIIMGRGGGSFEELNAFNHEGLARLMARCPVPIVSAVGHETDFTIADMVADERAATPTAAAARVVPDVREQLHRLRQAHARLKNALRRRVERDRMRLRAVQQAGVMRSPQRLLEARSMRIDELASRLQRAFEKLLVRRRSHLGHLEASLQALSPEAVFSRGYSVCLRLADGRIVRSVDDVLQGEKIEVRVLDGSLVSTVDAVLSAGGTPALRHAVQTTY